MEPVDSKVRVVWNSNLARIRYKRLPGCIHLLSMWAAEDYLYVMIQQWLPRYSRMNSIAFQQCSLYVFIAIVCFDFVLATTGWMLSRSAGGVPSLKVIDFSH